MSANPNEPLEKLIHDVNSKCASLKNAAGLLRQVPATEAAELLALMTQQAENLARAIADFKQEGRQ